MVALGCERVGLSAMHPAGAGFFTSEFRARWARERARVRTCIHRHARRIFESIGKETTKRGASIEEARRSTGAWPTAVQQEGLQHVQTGLRTFMRGMGFMSEEIADIRHLRECKRPEMRMVRVGAIERPAALDQAIR